MGAFREPEPSEGCPHVATSRTTRRARRPPWSASTPRQTVGNANGREKRACIKDVMPVPPDSTATREATEDVKLCVANILATPRTLVELRGRLGPEDTATLRAQKLLPVRKFLELCSDVFELRNGKWATREGAASSSAPQLPRRSFCLSANSWSSGATCSSSATGSGRRGRERQAPPRRASADPRGRPPRDPHVPSRPSGAPKPGNHRHATWPVA
jgi:hypothetical protein